MTETQGLTLAQAHVQGFELAREHTHRFAEFVRQLPAGAAEQPVVGSDWTVGQVVAHVQSIYLRYTQQRRRSASAQGVAAQNAEEVAQLGVDLDAAAVCVVEQLEALAVFVPQVAPDTTFPFHAGQRATLAAGWVNLLGELLAHGDDIARTVGIPFGIPGSDLEIFWRFTTPLLQGWVRPEARRARESWRLIFPFGPIDVELDHGALRWDTELSSAPDHVVHVEDTADLTLSFPYRRRLITDPGLALLAARFYDV